MFLWQGFLLQLGGCREWGCLLVGTPELGFDL